MAHLPLVLLSYTVQRVAGYGAFAREICPYSSPANIEAFPFDVKTLYETATAPHDTRAFSLFDRHNEPISNIEWSTDSKKDTLGSFFNLQKIQEVYDAPGLSIDDRIIYVPNGMYVKKFVKCRPPTLKRPGCEVDVSHHEIKTILDESKEQGRQFVFGGTDYGLVTMSTTTKLTQAQALNQIIAYNR